jgi:hypothetical protein
VGRIEVGWSGLGDGRFIGWYWRTSGKTLMFNNPLPAADFYRFACSFDLAGSCQQRCDLFFDEVANETRAVNDRRRAYLLAVAPELTEGIVGQINADQIYVDRRFSLRANLVHGTSWFDGRTPAHVGHYEQVKAPAMCESDSCRYIIVSAEWKNIIEQFDPGIHEFFPHVLRFVDGYISNRYSATPHHKAVGLFGTDPGDFG